MDGPNLYRSVQDKFGLKGGYDIQKLVMKLAHGRHAGRSMRLQRIFYCTSEVPTSFGTTHEDQRAFLDRLRSLRGIPVDVRLGRLQYDPGTREYHEKGVDVRVAVQLIGRAYDRRYDLALLVSRDGDYAPAVDWVRQTNSCRVLYSTVEGEPGWALSMSCNGFIPITRELLNLCMLHPGSTRAY